MNPIVSSSVSVSVILLILIGLGAYYYSQYGIPHFLQPTPTSEPAPAPAAAPAPATSSALTAPVPAPVTSAAEGAVATPTPIEPAPAPKPVFKPVRGRFVRIERMSWPEAGPLTGFINILEFTAYDKDNKPYAVTPSLTPQFRDDPVNFGPQFLSDLSITNNKVAQTKADGSAYVQLDLGEMKDIYRITFENDRRPCCSGRIVGTRAIILDSSEKTVWSSEVISEEQETYLYKLPSKEALKPDAPIKYKPDGVFLYGPGIKTAQYLPAKIITTDTGEEYYYAEEEGVTKIVNRDGEAKVLTGDASRFDPDRWIIYTRAPALQTFSYVSCPPECEVGCTRNDTGIFTGCIPFPAGQFVRLRRKSPPPGGAADGFINILEMIAYDKNLQRIPATATLQPQYLDATSFGPQYVTDNTIVNRRVAHTTADPNAHIQLNLGGTKEVKRIVIENRRGGSSNRIIGTEIQLLNSAGAVVWSAPITVNQDTYQFDLPSTATRKLSEPIEYRRENYFMYGPDIAFESRYIKVPPEQQKKVGDQMVYMISESGGVKMLNAATGVSKFYEGKMADFDPEKWATYETVDPGQYLLRMCPIELGDNVCNAPTNDAGGFDCLRGSDGKCTNTII
jgi:hypothetical protein